MNTPWNFSLIDFISKRVRFFFFFFFLLILNLPTTTTPKQYNTPSESLENIDSFLTPSLPTIFNSCIFLSNSEMLHKSRSLNNTKQPLSDRLNVFHSRNSCHTSTRYYCYRQSSHCSVASSAFLRRNNAPIRRRRFHTMQFNDNIQCFKIAAKFVYDFECLCGVVIAFSVSRFYEACVLQTRKYSCSQWDRTERQWNGIEFICYLQLWMAIFHKRL